MINPMDLTGRTILVTGASSGIGRATCILLADLGARVILVARRETALQETLSVMSGSEHVIVPFDLTDTDMIPEWLKKLAETYGKLHGLVHSAGIQLVRAIRDIDSDSIHSVMSINFDAAFGLIRGYRHKQVYADGASIVLLSSVAGLTGTAGNTLYSASKGAIIALVRSAAIELARQGIRVNCIAPGFVHTEMGNQLKTVFSEAQFQNLVDQHPLGIGTSENVAYGIAFLLADTGRWMTGTTLTMDGGYSAQ